MDSRIARRAGCVLEPSTASASCVRLSRFQFSGFGCGSSRGWNGAWEDRPHSKKQQLEVWL
jgi:hypothetical protein